MSSYCSILVIIVSFSMTQNPFDALVHDHEEMKFSIIKIAHIERKPIRILRGTLQNKKKEITDLHTNQFQ